MYGFQIPPMASMLVLQSAASIQLGVDIGRGARVIQLGGEHRRCNASKTQRKRPTYDKSHPWSIPSMQGDSKYSFDPVMSGTSGGAQGRFRCVCVGGGERAARRMCKEQKTREVGLFFWLLCFSPKPYFLECSYTFLWPSLHHTHMYI